MGKKKSSGKTIQTLAVFILVIELILSVAISVIGCLAGMSMLESKYEPTVVICSCVALCVLILCSIVCYIFIRSYGELVEDNRRTREALEKITSRLKSNS